VTTGGTSESKDLVVIVVPLPPDVSGSDDKEHPFRLYFKRRRFTGPFAEGRFHQFQRCLATFDRDDAWTTSSRHSLSITHIVPVVALRIAQPGDPVAGEAADRHTLSAD
jgi:hypothetical protein